MVTSPARRSSCPISVALELLGDRWTLLVVRDLALQGKRRFSELMESDEGIASNILTERLRRLEQWDVVTRGKDPDDRRRVVYGLTDKGRDLLPLMVELMRWSAKHDPQTVVSAAYQARLEQDREGILREFQARMACPNSPKP